MCESALIKPKHGILIIFIHLNDVVCKIKVIKRNHDRFYFSYHLYQRKIVNAAVRIGLNMKE